MAFRKYLAAAAAALWMMSAPASAQTAPNWYYGKVPTTAEWAAAWASKQDYLGASPCLVSGCVMTGPLVTIAPSNRAGFNLSPGAGPPSSLFNGDLWVTASGFFVQINGATLGPLLGGTQGANTILGNPSGTAIPTPLAIPSCSGASNAIQWVLNTGFQCGTITAAASSVAVGTTTITGGTIGNVFYHASGNLLGELTTSGSGTVLALAAGATLTTATITAPTISAPVLSGTITGTYTIGGTPSIPGSAINSGTISGSYLAAINMAASGNGGVTGVLPIANGGSGQSTQTAAFNALAPTPTRAGDVLCYSGSTWAALAGNNSGTQVLTENASGVCSWATITGTGTVTSITLAAGNGISLSGTNPITSSGTITINGAVPTPQGRITLAANTPVMTPTSCSGSACSNQTTLRYDCSRGGGGVPYFNGSIDLIDPITSCEVTDAMISAASAGQVVAAQVYDVWWVHGGANRICLAMSSAAGGGGGWASDTGGSNTARGTGYSQLDATTRPYTTNQNSIANCFNGSTNYGSVSANQATYLGTVYANGNGQISYVFPAFGAPPTAGLFGIYNAYNRVTTEGLVGESVATYTYNSTTPRQCHGDTTYNVQFVTGLSEDAVSAFSQQEATADASGNSLIAAIGLDASNAPAVTSLVGRSVGLNGGQSGVTARFSGQLLGFHGLYCVESVSAASAITIISNSTDGVQAGMVVTLRN